VRFSSFVVRNVAFVANGFRLDYSVVLNAQP
jgi:hypothetical protein